jgi:hypothetical protein
MQTDRTIRVVGIVAVILTKTCRANLNGDDFRRTAWNHNSIFNEFIICGRPESAGFVIRRFSTQILIDRRLKAKRKDWPSSSVKTVPWSQRGKRKSSGPVNSTRAGWLSA